MANSTARDCGWWFRRALLFAAAVHLAGILLVSVRELCWLIDNNLTIAPRATRPAARAIESGSLLLLGESAASSPVYHQLAATWLNATGIQGGYGFFAPNISGSYQLLFDFEFRDGHHEYELPQSRSREMTVRLASTLDEIDRTPVEVLRKQLIKLLMLEPMRHHPGAIAATATFIAAGSSDFSGIPPNASQVRYRYTFDLQSR